jgi:hypothetical protein
VSSTPRRMPHLRDEEGIALALAMLIMTVLAIALTSLIYYTSTNSRSSEHSRSQQVAHTLAEAGINNALGVIFNPLNAGDLLEPALLPSRTSTYAGGTVTWKGSIDADDVWTITATGTTKNRSGPGAAAVRRTLTARVGIQTPPVRDLTLAVWNWIYSARTGSSTGCDTTVDQAVSLVSPLFTEGSLCLRSTATVNGPALIVRGKLTLVNPQNSVGNAAKRVPMVHVGNGCQYQNNPIANPCANEPTVSPAPKTNVWADSLTTGATVPVDVSTVTLPPVDWTGWYQYASPGPYRPCTTTSGTVPVFDVMTTSPETGLPVPDGFNSPPGGNVPGVFNLAAGSSYTCKTRRGELSWNHLTHTLTVNGTIFIDGSATVNNGAVNTYNGQGVIYLSGTLQIKNSSLCAVTKMSGSKLVCDYTTPSASGGWDPNKQLLVIATHWKGGQNGAMNGTEIVSGDFQGGLYSDYDIEASTTSTTQGPLVSAGEVKLGQTNGVGFPPISIVPLGMPGYSPDIFNPDAPDSFG